MNAFRPIAQRIVNAEEDFVKIIQEKGFTHEEAIKVVQTMLRLKLAKLDAGIGRISVKHGALLESTVIRGIMEIPLPAKRHRRRSNGNSIGCR